MIVGCHVNRCHAAPHASITAHIRAARAEAEAECGVCLGAVQIFVSNPRQLTLSLEPGSAAVAELRAHIEETGLAVFAHSSYVAAPFSTGPTGDAGVAFIHQELAVCAAAGIRGLVVHLPKLPLDDLLARVPELIHPACAQVQIYLETPAVRPANAHYETGLKLGRLFRGLRAVDPDGSIFGLCIDTAHLWTSGIDISSLELATAWLAELPRAAARAVLFHANDSLRELGQGPDAHAGLAKGRIWSAYADSPAASGIAAFAAYAAEHGCSVILERKPKEALYSDYRLLAQLQPALRRAQCAGARGGAHCARPRARSSPCSPSARSCARGSQLVSPAPCAGAPAR